MELLSVSVLLVITRISNLNSQSFEDSFYRMEPYKDNSFDDLQPDDNSCDANGGGGSSSTSEEPEPTSMSEPPPMTEPSPMSEPPPMTDPPSEPTYSPSSPMEESNDNESNDYRLKATHIAEDAAEQAQAANKAQAGAAQDAERQVKAQLADKAMDAARTADAMFESTQAMVDSLARMIHDEEELMEQMRASLEVSEENAEAHEAAVKKSEDQAASLMSLVEETKASLAQIDALFEQSNADLDAKNRVMATTKERAESLVKQVAQARAEYEEVKNVACEAATAAMEAKQKAVSTMNCPKDGAGTGTPPPNPDCGGNNEAILDVYRLRRREQKRLRRQKQQQCLAIRGPLGGGNKRDRLPEWQQDPYFYCHRI